jgi:prevent-host-death family protein
MVTAGIKEARQHFTEYLAKVERGEEVIITRRNEPVARISPVKSPGSGRLASRRKLRESIVPKGKTLSRIVIGSREDGSF